MHQFNLVSFFFTNNDHNKKVLGCGGLGRFSVQGPEFKSSGLNQTCYFYS